MRKIASTGDAETNMVALMRSPYWEDVRSFLDRALRNMTHAPTRDAALQADNARAAIADCFDGAHPGAIADAADELVDRERIEAGLVAPVGTPARDGYHTTGAPTDWWLVRETEKSPDLAYVKAADSDEAFAQAAKKTGLSVHPHLRFARPVFTREAAMLGLTNERRKSVPAP